MKHSKDKRTPNSTQICAFGYIRHGFYLRKYLPKYLTVSVCLSTSVCIIFLRVC